MDEKVKAKLLALIKAKKEGGQKPFPVNKKDVYQSDGEKRKGVKQHKQGGLFDK